MNKAPIDDYERIVTTDDLSVQWLLGTHRSDTMRNRRDVYKVLNPDEDWIENVNFDKIRLKKVYMRPDKSEVGMWWQCKKHHQQAVRATRLTFE